MARITSLAIYGFRGIRNRISINFGPNGRSLVLSGENGRGKSSFADAIEWYFQESILHLRREGCQEHAYRHHRLPSTDEATVEIITSDANVGGAKHFDSTPRERWVNPSGGLVPFLAGAKGESIVLRHAQLKDFVHRTKTEKLQAIARIVGFEVVTETRDALLKAKNGLERDTDYTTTVGGLTEKTRDITLIIGVAPDSPATVLAAADKIRQEVGGDIPISDASTFAASVDKLLAATTEDSRTKQALVLRACERQLVQAAFPARLLDAGKEYVEKYDLFLQKKDVIERLALRTLYSAGMEVLQGSAEDLAECPLCGGPISRQELIAKLDLDLQALGAVVAEQAALRDQAGSLERQLEEYLSNTSKAIGPIEAATINGAVSWLSQAQLCISRVGEWGSSVALSAKSLHAPIRPTETDIEAFSIYEEQRGKLLKQVQAEIARLGESDAERIRNTKLENLRHLQSHFDRWIKLGDTERRFARQISAMSQIVQAFERVERDELENVVAAISTEVNDFYLALHPNEGFDQIRLCPTPDRGLEFQLLFKGDPITPPTRLLSESHLNTLGLCFFLASAVHFNRGCEFIVLDDVVSSVDENHRLLLARLLRDDPRLSSRQFIILSHDRHWSDILRQTFPEWMHKKIETWDYDLGLTINDVQVLRNQIADALTRGDAIDAGHKVRMLAEAIFKGICEHYDVPMPYRQGVENERRDLLNFVHAVRGFFGANNRFDSSRPPLLDIERCLWLMNIASHPDPRQLNLAPGDVRTVLRDVETFEGRFYSHAPACGHRGTRLRWNQQAGAFSMCPHCSEPL